MSVYIGPDGNVWSDGKPLDVKDWSKLTTATTPSATHKMPTIAELCDLVKKFPAPKLPALLSFEPLEVPVNFGPSPLSGIYSKWKSAEMLMHYMKQSMLKSLALPPTALEGNFSSAALANLLDDQFVAKLYGIAPLEPIRRRQLVHDDAHLFQKPETKDRGRQFDEQEILRASGKTRCQYAWSEALQAHVQIGGPLR